MQGSRATAPSSTDKDALVQELGALYRGRPPPPLPEDAFDAEPAGAPGTQGEGFDELEPSNAAGMAPMAAATVARTPPAGVPLFSRLSPQTYGALLDRMHAWDVDAGALVVGEGEQADSVFVIVSGAVRVERKSGAAGSRERVVLATLEAGSFFGEGALLSRKPRAASVVATERCVLLELPRVVLEELAQEDPHVAMVLQSFARQRLVENLARTSPVFQGLSAPVVGAALSGFDLRRLPRSTVVITQGTQGSGLYLVVDGSLDVLARGAHGQVHVKALSAGDVFGEMTLLGGAVTSASVVCASDCTLLALPRARFAALSAALPELRARLEALAAERRTHNERYLPDATSSAVLG